ncbi:hypothetical protein [Undibacterium flavidum]|uniref:Uncharacterized protein n=1 Tax=Undibacterium flavidum TaxID=2762297 RepID=A0ABR6YE99_9BURK|nr:hypothetical protein [Undibacterium flavidum]MBC3874884.1 hypothetical protein [Undibacterium flavidum]
METTGIKNFSRKKIDKLVEEKKKDFDFVKWISLIITMSGILFWMAGTAYESGYWHLLGADGSFIPRTFQRTALSGFIGPFEVWLYGAVILLGYALLLFFAVLISSSIHRPKVLPKIFIQIESWFDKKKTVDAATLKFPIILITIFMAIIVAIIPCLVIVGLAYKEGATQMNQEICNARTVKEFATSINLFDGTKVQGKFIGRSEKLSVLLNNKAISVITISDKPQVIDTTNVLEVLCKRKK